MSSATALVGEAGRSVGEVPFPKSRSCGRCDRAHAALERLPACDETLDVSSRNDRGAFACAKRNKNSTRIYRRSRRFRPDEPAFRRGHAHRALIWRRRRFGRNERA